MKRASVLRRLSSEHHRALVLAQRLRAADGNAAQRCAAADTALAQWRAEVAPHFVAEEERLLPLYARFSAPDTPLITETLRQHVAMRALVDAIAERCAAGDVEATLLHDLGNALRDHVRFEENELFPAIEAALSSEQLRRLQAVLSESSPTHNRYQRVRQQIISIRRQTCSRSTSTTTARSNPSPSPRAKGRPPSA